MFWVSPDVSGAFTDLDFGRPMRGEIRSLFRIPGSITARSRRIALTTQPMESPRVVLSTIIELEKSHGG